MLYVLREEGGNKIVFSTPAPSTVYLTRSLLRKMRSNGRLIPMVGPSRFSQIMAALTTSAAFLCAISMPPARRDIFGSDYKIPDGIYIRDCIQVSDLADVHVHAMISLGECRLERAHNLGTGKGHSVKEVIDTARRVTRRDFAVSNGPCRPGDPASLVADATLAHRDLGWLTRYPTITDLIETAWAWSNRSSAVILKSA